MSRLNIVSNNIDFSILEGDLFEVPDGDGIGYYPISWVVATFNDIQYYYPIHFLAKFVYMTSDCGQHDDDIFVNSRNLCNNFIEEVKAYGSLNIKKWNVLKN